MAQTDVLQQENTLALNLECQAANKAQQLVTIGN